MSYIFSSVIGTVCYTVVVFVAGSYIGRELFGWVKKFMPWTKG